MTRKKTSVAKAKSGTAIVRVTDPAQALAVIDRAGAAPAKIGATVQTVVMRETGAVMAAGVIYHAGDLTITDAEVYYVDDQRQRRSDGPWRGEADKVAWRDPHTGYECILMRATHGGYLSGYVGVPVGHPLWGFDHDAVPADIGIEVHGGLAYARMCEDGPTPARRIVVEARRICHVVTGSVPTTHATGYRVEDAHAWWFGFECNHLYDVIPDVRAGAARRYLTAETGAVYRDDAYVCAEIQHLAAQLRAVADGEPMPRRHGPPLPPIGLDPHRGR